MSSSKLILAFLGVFILFASCKKYPDGPKFTLLGKKDRMQGLWDLKETVHVNGSITYDSSADIMELTDDNEYFYRTGVVTINGKWDFESDKEKVSFTIGNANYTYRIRRLKDKQLWLHDETNGDLMKFKNTDKD